VVQLVTPIFVSTSVAGSEVVPAFAIMNVLFSPEPVSLALGLGAVGTLISLGLKKRS
jgi:hypothetical protein